jgi:aryl-alcohol dehydrogenase-like predicted oxidoreductase
MVMDSGRQSFREPRRLGRSGLLVTPIGLGCWQFSQGGNLPGRYWTILADDEIRAIVARALALGLNWFDTAEGYGGGASEKALSAALRAAGVAPGRVLIATKWSPLLRRAASIPATIETRLANLTPYPIDLFQIHNPLSVSSIESQVGAMARLVGERKIRAVGVSNFSRRQMERAHRELERLGLPLASNQVRYSLLDRCIETNGVLEAAKDLGIAIIAYSPLAQGLLSGKFHDDPGLVRRLPGFRKYMPAFWRRGLERSRPVIEALRRIAPGYGATPAQAALNWVILSQGESVVAIPGAAKAGQVDDFAAAMAFRLSEADMAELDRVSAPYKRS